MSYAGNSRDTDSAKSSVRFYDWDTMKYSLRSIEKYAKWIRNIYIVTNGQIPQWLHISERIRIISHHEIFDDTTLLPTFNSNSIELQLHRIPGLSTKFIYFNDDMLLTSSVDPSDFLHGLNGQNIRKEGEKVCVFF